MKVILLTNVANLGRKYDIVNVKEGYALNFLFPTKKAKPASEGGMKEVESMKKRQIMHIEELKAHEKEVGAQIRDLKKIIFKRKVSQKNHLFAAITEKDIAEVLKGQLRIEIPAAAVEMSGHIKETGNHMVTIHVGSVKESLEVIVEAE